MLLMSVFLGISDHCISHYIHDHRIAVLRAHTLPKQPQHTRNSAQRSHSALRLRRRHRHPTRARTCSRRRTSACLTSTHTRHRRPSHRRSRSRIHQRRLPTRRARLHNLLRRARDHGRKWERRATHHERGIRHLDLLPSNQCRAAVAENVAGDLDHAVERGGGVDAAAGCEDGELGACQSGQWRGGGGGHVGREAVGGEG